MSAKECVENVLAYADDSNVKSDLLYYKQFDEFLFQLFYSEYFDCMIKIVGNRSFMDEEGGWTMYASSESAIETLKWKAGLKNIKKYLTD
ncbi:hypothetical protein vBAbaPP1_131 [Acinetobacter phage vB_AbaM_P1]|nr:hypothetical protein vBAbaMD22_101 [Acinetobacter phage vB_AbaM_D22]UJE34742.1 hypothetical protein vBAbaPP1_131 [Acinetobacter phage vB_AbaM_P1]WAX22612.1 hypothetical protein [Acinetobacter phage vB_AbaP_HB01]